MIATYKQLVEHPINNWSKRLNSILSCADESSKTEADRYAKICDDSLKKYINIENEENITVLQRLCKLEQQEL